MSDLSLEDQVRATAMGADMMRLIELDDLWTSAVLSTSLVPSNQRPPMESLQAVAGEMVDVLKRMGEYSGLLSSIGESLGADGDDRLNSLLWTNEFSAEDKQDLRWLSTRLGGFEGLARSASEAVADYLPEINSIERQLATLRDGGRSAGDLSRKYRCGLGQGIIVAGVASVPATAAAAAGTGLAIGALGAALMVAATGGVAGIAVIIGGLLIIRKSRC